MRKYQYGLLYLGTVFYLFVLAIIILPKAAEENRKEYVKEVAKWDSVFHKRCDCK